MASIIWIADGATLVRTWLQGAQESSDEALADRVVALLRDPHASQPQFHTDLDRGIAQVVMVPENGVHYFVAVLEGDDRD